MFWTGLLRFFGVLSLLGALLRFVSSIDAGIVGIGGGGAVGSVCTSAVLFSLAMIIEMLEELRDDGEDEE